VKVGLLDSLLQFFSRNLARIIFVHFLKLLLQQFDLFSIDHLYKHVHRGLFEHTNPLELAEAHHHIFIDFLCIMIVVLTFFFDVAEPRVLKCLPGSQSLFRVCNQKFLYQVNYLRSTNFEFLVIEMVFTFLDFGKDLTTISALEW